MRGNHDEALAAKLRTGSIPARAGEPFRRLLLFTILGVYPRACGGTVGAVMVDGGGLGLSPRVRGNPVTALTCSNFSGSIPARAGEPCFPQPSTGTGWVYPRACGGTTHALAAFRYT